MRAAAWLGPCAVLGLILLGCQGVVGPVGPAGAQGAPGARGLQGGNGDPFMVVSVQSASPSVKIVDGVWRVGKDIQPGLYFTQSGASPLQVGNCYWARLKGFTGGEIIANGNTPGPSYVRILPTDAGFHSQSCNAWIRVSD